MSSVFYAEISQRKIISAGTFILHIENLHHYIVFLVHALCDLLAGPYQGRTLCERDSGGKRQSEGKEDPFQNGQLIVLCAGHTGDARNSRSSRALLQGGSCGELPWKSGRYGRCLCIWPHVIPDGSQDCRRI